MTSEAGPYFRPATLTIRLFGAYEVRRSGQLLPRTRTRKEQWLLALLVLRAGQPLDRAWLSGLLWPDSPESTALTNLRRTLPELRRALGPDAVRLSNPTPRTLAMDLGGVSVDVLEFDSAVACGDAASLEQAISLYRGQLLEGCAEEWVLAERARREQSYLQALEALGAHSLEQGEAGAAATYLRRALSVDAFRESTYRTLIQALGASGDYGAVVQVYRDLRLLLHQELNTAPAAETTALFEQIRARGREGGGVHHGDPEQSPRAGTETRSLHGEEWRGRAVAVSGQQPGITHHSPLTTHPSAERPTPNAQRRSRIPQPLSSLVGREQELEELKMRLGSARLVTLTGPGGVGKTRLATRALEELAGEYPDGGWFVGLSALWQPDQVLHTVADTLGIREEPGRPVLETLVDALHSRSLLILLDNCEHLLETSARIVEGILLHCREVRVLATSREALGVAGEVAWRVPSLLTPDMGAIEWADKDAVSSLLEYDAVRLFVERAVQARPGFRLVRENARAAVEVCRRLDGIPLAIELAAARVKVLSVEEIAARLDDRFRLLTGGSRTAPPHQQTLRATLDWSYHLLSGPEQALFRRLSAFPGSWTLEAAEAVGSGQWAVVSEGPEPPSPNAQQLARMGPTPNANDVLDLLGQLVDKSLVITEEPHPEGAGAPRYRLLETLRQYGQDRLQESGEGETVRRRHLDYFLGLAEEGESKRYGAREAAWLERLEVEHDNLRAALASAVEAEETGLGLRLGGALWRFWSTRGYTGEGRRQLAPLLTLAGSLAPATSTRAEDGWRARALLGAGSLSLEAGDSWEARSLCEESLGLWRTLGDMGGVAESLTALGNIEQSQGGYVAARSLFAEGLAIQRELGDRWGIANSLERLGRLSYCQGDYDLGRDQVEAALAIRRELGDRRGIAGSLTLLGNIARLHGEYEAARLLYEESLAISRGPGDKHSIGPLLNALGELLRLQGEYARATELLEEGLAICQEIGDPGAAANTRQDLGHIALDQGEHGHAEALFEESLAVYRKLSDLRGIAWALADLGTVALRQGDWEAAARHYRESLATRRDLNDRRGTAECLEGLAALASATEQAGRATRLFGAAERLREVIHAPRAASEQEANRHSVSRAREMLPEEAFAAAWAEGQAMSLEQAIAYALEEAVDR